MAKTLASVICGLCALQAPPDFVLTVLLVACTTEGGISEDLKWIEFFAGRAEATRAHKMAGYPSAKLDINFFTEPEGTRGSGNNYYDILTPAGFAVCVATILRGDSDDLLVLLGMKCSSWSRVNQGTSMRQPCCPDGDSSKKSVFTANCMAARTICLCLLVTAVGGTWLLEQPYQSLLRWYGRFRFLSYQMRVFESCWWIRHYGGDSPKRHVMFSNSPWVSELSLGRLVGWRKEINEDKKPCRTYVDSKGVRRFVGTKHLKGTEHYPYRFGLKLVQLRERLVSDKSGVPSRGSGEPATTSHMMAMFQKMDWSQCWDEANLKEVNQYLLGSRCLKLPEYYKAMIPFSG